jgi:hypothetical protein
LNAVPHTSHGIDSGEPAATVARSVLFVTSYSVTEKDGRGNDREVPVGAAARGAKPIFWAGGLARDRAADHAV